MRTVSKGLIWQRRGAKRCRNVLSLLGPNPQVYEFVRFQTGNYGVLKVSGLDFNVNYRLKTGFGGVDAAVSGNYQLSRKQQVSPTSAVIDELGPIGQNSRLQLQATLGTDIGRFRGQVQLDHTSGYPVLVTATSPQSHIGSFNTVNMFLKYDVPATSSLLQNLNLTLQISNLLDQDPPADLDPASNGYAINGGFTLGRMITFGVSKKF